MKLINPDYLMDIIINEPEAYGYVCAYDIQNAPTIDTDDFSRRTMSQCLTEDYCKGWNDCYEDIMEKLETMKGKATNLGAPVKIIDNEFELQGYIVREKYYHCPNCELTLGTLRYDDLLTLASENKFCKKCGEKLNWGNLIAQTIK